MNRAWKISDSTFTPIKTSTAFTAGTFVWSDIVDTHLFNKLVVSFTPTVLGSNTQVDVVVQWSDSAVAFDDVSNFEQTDALIGSSTDGSYKPFPYTSRYTSADGTLVANKKQKLTFPVNGARARVGVKGNNASGTFTLDALRLSH